MQAGTVAVPVRFWQEGCMKAVTFCDSFYRRFKCLEVICRLCPAPCRNQEAVLTRCKAVVAAFRLHPRLRQAQHDIAANALRKINGACIVIAGHLMRNRCRPSLIVRVE